MKQGSWLRKQSLSKQLLVNFGASLATVGLATLGINYALIQADLGKQVHARAESITQSLEFSTEGLLELKHRSLLRRIVQNYATLPAVVEIAIAAPDGSILTDSSGSRPGQAYASLHPELAGAMKEAVDTGIPLSREILLQGKPVLVEMLPFSSVLFGTSGKRGLAIALMDLQQLRYETGKTFLTSTFILLSGILIILVLMSLLIHRTVLKPLNALNEAVKYSKKSGNFVMPEALPDNEVRFLAKTFKTVFEELEVNEQLRSEIAQRQKIEANLRESETAAKQKSQELSETLEELKQAQTRLVQSEKMSSLGQLVAGIAHEINNPINFIHGNIHYASEYVQTILELQHLYEKYYPNPPDELQDLIEDADLSFLQEDLPKLLSSMQLGADRIRLIVQSLRTFSRLDEAEVKDVDLHEGIDSTLMILQSRLKAKADHPAIEVIKHYGQLPKIECYAGQLNQVFMNILVNAIDALDEYNAKRSLEEISNHPGQITISTELLPSQRIAIRIADNGPGMSEEVQQRLFDPFFTTKAVGKGTGMGMSISYQIVTEKHQGALRCVSTLGAGTEFLIELPLKRDRLPAAPEPLTSQAVP